ncbi:LPS assembly protein LptD [Candidatus Binatia bacterium]|nr:LPS assembly protein LptD [Candidatus Binatia bacterium]
MRCGFREAAARRVRWALLVFVLAAVAGGAGAQIRPVFESEQVTIDADEVTYDRRTDTVSARGNVVVKRGDTELHADEVRFNRITNIADASGRVLLSDPQGLLTADALSLNLEEETGIIEGANITSRLNQYSLQGARVEKGLGQSFRIRDGRFTTCRCAEGPPSWSISGEDLEVTLGGYGRLKGGTFNILDVPVLYVPRAIFPVELDRQTGFLVPQFGFSNRRGFQTLLPFYWAIDRSQDLTIAGDVETSARIGVVGEYRYFWPRDAAGVIETSYFNEFFRGQATGTSFEPVIPENRWSVVNQHRQPVAGPLQLYADSLVVSDDLFLREINTYAFTYGREVAVRTLPYTRTWGGLGAGWDRVAVRGQGVYYQNLLGPESQVLQRVPELDADAQMSFGRWALGELDLGGMLYQRGQGTDGMRLDVVPGVTVPLPVGRYAFGAVRAAFRETAYYVTDPDVVGPRYAGAPAVLPATANRALPIVHAGVGTSIARVFDFDLLGVDKVKHSIEPMLEYLYVPFVSQESLPFWDGVDRVDQRSLFTYGATTRLVGRFADPGLSPAPAPETESFLGGGDLGPADERYRELARLSLMQSADVLREIEPLQPGRAADHFSDIDFAGRVNPARALSFRFAANYDVSNNDLTATRVGLFVEDPWTARGERFLETRTSAGITYRFISGNQLREVNGNVVLRVTDWFGLFYAGRYDAVTSNFLGNYWGVRFISTCDCWSVDIAVNQRTSPSETEVRAQFVLVGLGASGPRTRVASGP